MPNLSSLLSLSLLSSGTCPGAAWLSVPLISQRQQRSLRLSTSSSVLSASNSNNPPESFVDAEFERVVDADPAHSNEEAETSETSSTSSSSLSDSASLMDIYAQDPDLQSLRIPFVDGEQVIDVKLGFMVELDDNNNNNSPKVQYAIGIPFDACAAITIETQNGAQVQNISPDDSDNDDEHTELMEIMASQLQEQVGPDLQLIKSPRVLTIAGPLDKYTAHWKDQALPKSLTADELLNTDDEDIESFLAFMKDELGEEEFTKTMKEEHTFDEETMALFSMPGMGGASDDDDDGDDFAQFLKSELSTVDPQREEEQLQQVLGNDMDHDGVALKLVSYGMPNGKKYSLVKLENPVILVAKQIGTEKAPQFELLSREEMKLVTPRLEEVCKDDLEKLGLLGGSGTSDGTLNSNEQSTTNNDVSTSFGPGPDSHALLKEVFPALQAHEQEFGNPNIPLGTTEGRICETLRRLQIQKKLSDADVELLDSMGFRWHSLEDVYRTADFDELFARLVQYKEDTDGNVSPPKKYPQDPELGAWVTGIRRVGRENIPQDQINQLEGIGFEWVSKRKCGSSFMTQYRQIKDEIEYASPDDPLACFNNSANTKWLKAQQQAHEKKALSSTRVHYMEELLGEDWDTLNVH